MQQGVLSLALNRAFILGALVDPNSGLPHCRPLIHVALEAMRRCALLTLSTSNSWCVGEGAVGRAGACSVFSRAMILAA